MWEEFLSSTSYGAEDLWMFCNTSLCGKPWIWMIMYDAKQNTQGLFREGPKYDETTFSIAV